MEKIINQVKMIVSLIILVVSSIVTPFMKSDKVLSDIKLKTSAEYINEIGPEIIRCINKKDKIGLSCLFCEKVRNTDYINREVNFLFDYVNNNSNLIIDDNGNWVSNGGHGVNNLGRKTVNFEGWIYDKEILIGSKKYTLECGAYTIMIGRKEYEGITYITFCDVRNLSNLSLERFNIAYNNQNEFAFLGIGIFNFNYDTLRYENVAPKEIYENEEYRFSFDELEKGSSDW